MALFKVKPWYKKRGGISYRGTASSLTEAKSKLAATTVQDICVFANGDIRGNGDMSVMHYNCYNASLTNLCYSEANKSFGFSAATSVGDYALFGGGEDNNNRSTDNVYVIDKRCVRYASKILTDTVYASAAATTGNYAIFNGGFNSGSRPIMNCFDTSLTRSGSWGSLQAGALAATTVDNLAMFGGGYWGSTVNSTIEIYNSSLTCQTLNRSMFRSYGAAAAVGDYAIFLGGTYNTTTYVISTSLTITLLYLGLLPGNTWQGLAATSVGDYALFGGGRINGNNIPWTDNAAVFCFDKSLTVTTPTPLSLGRYYLAAASVGKYALFGGGYSDTNAIYCDTVDVYQVS